MLHTTPHERKEFARMAEAAQAKGYHQTANRFLAASTVITMTTSEYDPLMHDYRAWLTRNEFPIEKRVTLSLSGVQAMLLQNLLEEYDSGCHPCDDLTRRMAGEIIAAIREG